MKQIFDEVRKTWVAASPEEIVRQLWVKKMTEELDYPEELMAVEKELKSLPHLASHLAIVPDRRVDIICFGKNVHPIYQLFPILLVECKAEPLSQKALEQVIGYNAYVQASYVALVNDREVVFRYNLGYKLCQLDRLPSFQELSNEIAKR
jgi:hypothetical protein